MTSVSLQTYAAAVPYPVQKKLLSILDGYHQGSRAGRSLEFLDMEEYKPGDAITDIDWKATARIKQAVVKRFESTAVLNVVLAADTGSNMAALAPGDNQTDITKAKLSAELLRVIAWLVAKHGDHLGLVAGNKAGTRMLPARVGMGHAETLLRAATTTDPQAAPPDLPALLRRLRSTVRKRSLILLVTDANQITEQVAVSLRRLAHRNLVGLFLIEDYDPTAAPVGRPLADVKAGRIPNFVTAEPQISAQWADYRRATRARVNRLLSPLPVSYGYVADQTQILPALINVLGGLERGASVA